MRAYTFLLLYSDPSPIQPPTLFTVEAMSVDDAIHSAAKQYGWTVTEVDGDQVWYAKDGKDFRYSVG